MRALTYSDGKLSIEERPDPSPGAGEIAVRVRAAGLNNADLLQVRGFYPAPPGSPPDIPGLELAGEVVAVGEGVTRFAVGDRAMAVVGGGAQAEVAVVHERAAMPVPGPMTWEEAGAFPEAFTTAHDALFTQAGLAMGERLCVHGAAGGVGVAAVQIAVAAGAFVTGTVRDPEARALLEGLVPAVRGVPSDDFVGSGPYDVILELVGGVNLADNLKALEVGGRISVIGVGSGARAELDLLALMGKRARIFGSTLRARPLEQKADAARRVERSVLPLVEQGRVQVPVLAEFPLARAAEAYELFAKPGKFGKIVITFE
ncbi:MAG: alcohol dehydrogenase catalytic domain-containing protein [Acidimicrobiia bacterium]